MFFQPYFRSYKVLNRWNDCGDFSDEFRDCEANEFRCDKFTCISISLACDGKKDCDNGVDEKNCKYCPDGFFRCKDSWQCISGQRVCDGERDCRHGEDEEDCKFEECKETEFRCRSGRCIEAERRCDGGYDCTDWSDEAGCDGCDFDCGDGECVHSNLTCDGVRDCRNGHDERNCTVEMQMALFFCTVTTVLLLSVLILLFPRVTKKWRGPNANMIIEQEMQ